MFKTLFLFDEKNKIRLFMFDLAEKSVFETFVLVLIITSSIILTLDDPLLDPNSTYKIVPAYMIKQKYTPKKMQIISFFVSLYTQKALYYIDFVITVLFVVETTVKIIAYGFFFNGEQSYLRSLSNDLGRTKNILSCTLHSLIHSYT